MIGYNFGLGFMPGPFCFGASSLVCGLPVLPVLEVLRQMRLVQAVSFLPDRP